MTRLSKILILGVLLLVGLGLVWVLDEGEPPAKVGASVQGQVIDGASDAPVAAQVELRCGESQVLMQQSGQDGAFLFEKLPAGPCRLSAEAQGYVAGMRSSKALMDLELLAGERLVDVSLLLYRPNRISGLVSGPEGAVAGARLGLFVIEAPDAVHSYSEEMDVQSDSEGRFLFEGLGSGQVRVLAEADGLVLAQSRVLQLGSGDHIQDLHILMRAQTLTQASPEPRIVVSRQNESVQESETGGLAGRVLAEGSGLPLQRFEVRLLSLRQASDSSARMPSRASRRVFDPEGRFLLEELEPGRYSLQIETHNWSPARLADVRVEAGGVTDLGDLFLQGPGGLRGRVVDAGTRQPLADVSVGALGASRRSVRSRSAADGTFFLPSLPADLVSVGLAKPGYLRELVSGIRIRSGETSDIGDVALEATAEPGSGFAYAGMGASLSEERGRLLVGEVFEGAPATQVGLVPGSQILKVDGQDVSGLGLRGAVERIRGPEGSMVSLEVVLPGETSSRLLHIQRGRVISPARQGP